MDLRFTPEELAFRDEVRAFFRANLPDEHPHQAGRRKEARQGRHRRLAAHSEPEGLGGRQLAGRVGRHRLDAGSAIHLPGGIAADPGAAAARLRRHDGRAGDDRLRLRRAEKALSAAHRQSRRLVVPGLFRAGRGLGPRLAAEPRRSARATITSSTARRPGRPWRSTPIGSSAWCAPTRRPRSRRGSPSC